MPCQMKERGKPARRGPFALAESRSALGPTASPGHQAGEGARDLDFGPFRSSSPASIETAILRFIHGADNSCERTAYGSFAAGGSNCRIDSPNTEIGHGPRLRHHARCGQNCDFPIACDQHTDLAAPTRACIDRRCCRGRIGPCRRPCGHARSGAPAWVVQVFVLTPLMTSRVGPQRWIMGCQVALRRRPNACHRHRPRRQPRQQRGVDQVAVSSSA